MNRPVLAVLLTCALLVALLLCLPVFREGLGVANELVYNSLREPRDFGLSDDRLQRLSAKAERDHDANLMASLALRSSGEVAVVRAQRAVALDQNLTWIYSITCDSYPESALSACAGMIHELQAWDPANSLPYLLDAQRVARLNDPQSRRAGAPVNDPAWHAAMAQAFAAPRYDNYQSRLAALNRRLYAVQRKASLTEFNDSLLMNLRIPDLTQVRGYAPEVLASNPQAMIDFAHRVQAGASTPLELMLAANWLRLAYDRENQLKPGSISPLQIAAEKRLADRGIQHETNFFPLLDPLAKTFQVTVFVQALSLAALALMALVAGLQWLRRRKVTGGTQVLVSVAAVAFGSASVAMFLVYRPYSELAHGMTDGTIPTDSYQPWIFASLYHSAFWTDIGPTFWTGMIVVCGIALVGVAARAIFNRRHPALKTA